MSLHPHAGQLPTPDMLTDVPTLVSAYYTDFPSPTEPSQRVSFGTSGHRGSSLDCSFNEEHIYAIAQAVCDYRASHGIKGPLFLGGDSHALSCPAFRSALEVLVANGVHVFMAPEGEYTATPVISHAILSWNAEHTGSAQADGIIITPSHNPPRDGGFKYNPPHGGPAETEVTSWIERRANEHLETSNRAVQIMHYRAARQAAQVKVYDFTSRYVDDLADVLNMEAIAASGLSLGVDPLGGASLPLWEPIAHKYGLALTVVNTEVDPSFRFVPCDKDGKIRMDCSSPYAMSRLLGLRDRFDLAFACDPDADRHGIVTRSELMNPNHFLSAASWYLFRSRTQWGKGCGIGKTLVTSAMLDRVGEELGRPVVEVPVGFKWFVPYLYSGRCAFGCEESAGASFLTRDGRPWSTDKDGPLLCLLAAEMMASEGKSPSEIYAGLTERHGAPRYQRLDAPADDRVRRLLKGLDAAHIDLRELAGDPVESVITRAPGNDAPIGGVKITSRRGWFAVRPSGTEPICKVYTESFGDEEHLRRLQKDAIDFLDRLLQNA
ncbi:MAG TPA: phosphoglucomutase [Candidatus Desulfovibrio intestinavium]|uniref:Phosphoglucomutase n=1 Tax=Candidatus Desulfovibrio intestinavium TaxID=2838534 RepID=A0A9D2HN16_9BACT|nr:phosphoglucomutase [Candidatus Desulfovibrio intestinavium]